MKYEILDYDANAPMAKCITVPVNSAYGVAVKVYKDGEKVDVKTDELSVNGLTASGLQNGFNIFELSSGSDIGMTSFDVDVKTGIYGQVSNIAERINSRPSISNLGIHVYLSSFISEPTYFKATDIRWTELLLRSTSSSGEYPDNWKEFTTLLGGVNLIICVYPTTGGLISYGFQEDYPNYEAIGELYRNKWSTVNPETGETQPSEKILVYPDGYVYIQYNVGPRTKVQIKYTLTVDTHGVKAKFPLQVVQTDTNYFEI